MDILPNGQSFNQSIPLFQQSLTPCSAFHGSHMDCANGAGLCSPSNHRSPSPLPLHLSSSHDYVSFSDDCLIAALLNPAGATDTSALVKDKDEFLSSHLPSDAYPDTNEPHSNVVQEAEVNSFEDPNHPSGNFATIAESATGTGKYSAPSQQLPGPAPSQQFFQVQVETKGSQPCHAFVEDIKVLTAAAVDNMIVIDQVTDTWADSLARSGGENSSLAGVTSSRQTVNDQSLKEVNLLLNLTIEQLCALRRKCSNLREKEEARSVDEPLRRCHQSDASANLPEDAFCGLNNPSSHTSGAAMFGSWHPPNLQLPSRSSSLEDNAYEGLQMQLQHAMATPQTGASKGFNLHTANGSNGVGNSVDHGRSLDSSAEPSQAYCARIHGASAGLYPDGAPSISPSGHTAPWRRTRSNGWEENAEGANVRLPTRQQGHMSKRDLQSSTTEAAIEGLLDGTLRGWKPKDSQIDGRTSRPLPFEEVFAAMEASQEGERFASQSNEVPHLDGSEADVQGSLLGLSTEEEAWFASLDDHATVSTKKSKSFDTRILDRQRVPSWVEGLEANTAPSALLSNLTSLRGLEHNARATLSGVSSPLKRSRDYWQAPVGPGFPGVTALSRAFSVPASVKVHSAEDLFSLPSSVNGRDPTFSSSLPYSYPQDGPVHTVAPVPLSLRQNKSSFPNHRNPQGDATRPRSLMEDKYGSLLRHHDSFLPNEPETMQEGNAFRDIPFIERLEEMVDVDGETEAGALVPENALGALTRDNALGSSCKVKQGEVENGELAAGLVGLGSFHDVKAADALRSSAGRGKKGKAKEEETLDKWHWRKYGQKKIKDSVSYRSYYHCGARSTLKCAAKRHVDRLNADHSVSSIVYTTEHCHDPPVRNHLTIDRWRTLRVSSMDGFLNGSRPLVPPNEDTPRL
eukprot:TRINITY_DN1177_c0_g1_i1.p1 TRINITY_DN1177_c0_g1~~TRINITY_DN1177_c0_g1_i1.p1  ORF type:complete len:920 (-),score=109.97 TRINITY_DN1177_c0_g1_i1:499-3231(-)